MRWSSVGHELRRSPSRGHADADPDHGHPDELHEAARELEAALADGGEDGGEGHQRGPVVEEALVLDDGAQARRAP